MEILNLDLLGFKTIFLMIYVFVRNNGIDLGVVIEDI